MLRVGPPRKVASMDDVTKLVVLMDRFAKKLGMKVLDDRDNHKQLLFDNLCGENSIAEGRLLEDDGHAVGYCVFYWSFSTFRGVPNLFVEDVFVSGDDRGNQLGELLLGYLSHRAHQKSADKVHLAFPTGNTKLQKYYSDLGFVPDDDWTYLRYPVKRLWEQLPDNWLILR